MEGSIARDKGKGLVESENPYEGFDEGELNVGNIIVEFVEFVAANPPVRFRESIPMHIRFQNIRAHRSDCTILPSTEEMRAYFHSQEVKRYSNPDRAFTYLSHDGRISTVAPLTRYLESPPRARSHDLLKRQRPPQFTLLSLVRDAACRLPDRIGTRDDIILLARDSQFLVENATDDQLQSVVTGALDRLRPEFDPCIRFDSDIHLWRYLHADRRDEDFE